MNENFFEPIELLEPLSLELDSFICLTTLHCNQGYICKVGTIMY